MIGGLDPYETARNEWLDDVDLWPSVTSIHIGMYLLVTPSPYTGKDLVNYKSLDCYINFLSGWVREIQNQNLNSGTAQIADNLGNSRKEKKKLSVVT